jgi:hypothetical protein
MTYNGYENYETWNVAQYINNDWYMIARQCIDWFQFRAWLHKEKIFKTPDNISLTDKLLDVETLNEVIIEVYKCK